jgi:hypothetical protein
MTRTINRALVLLFSALALQLGAADAAAQGTGTDVTIKGSVTQIQNSTGKGEDENNLQELNIGNIKNNQGSTKVVIDSITQEQSGKGNQQQLNVGNADGSGSTNVTMGSIHQSQSGSKNKQGIHVGNSRGTGNTEVKTGNVTQIQIGTNNTQGILVGNTENKKTEVTVGNIYQHQHGYGATNTQIISVGVSKTNDTKVTVGDIQQTQAEISGGKCQEIIIGYDSSVQVGDVIQVGNDGYANGERHAGGKIHIGNSGNAGTCAYKKDDTVVIDYPVNDDGFRPTLGESFEENYREFYPEEQVAEEEEEEEHIPWYRFDKKIKKNIDKFLKKVSEAWQAFMDDMSVGNFFRAIGDTLSAGFELVRSNIDALTQSLSDAFSWLVDKLPLPDSVKGFLKGMFDGVINFLGSALKTIQSFVEGLVVGLWELITMVIDIIEYIYAAIYHAIFSLIDLFIDLDSLGIDLPIRDWAKKRFDDGNAAIKGMVDLVVMFAKDPGGTTRMIGAAIKQGVQGCMADRGVAECIAYGLGRIGAEILGSKGAGLVIGGVAKVGKIPAMLGKIGGAMEKVGSGIKSTKPIQTIIKAYNKSPSLQTIGGGIKKTAGVTGYVLNGDFFTFKGGFRFRSHKTYLEDMAKLSPNTSPGASTAARSAGDVDTPDTPGVASSAPKVNEPGGGSVAPGRAAANDNVINLDDYRRARGPPPKNTPPSGGAGKPPAEVVDFAAYKAARNAGNTAPHGTPGNAGREISTTARVGDNVGGAGRTDIPTTGRNASGTPEGSNVVRLDDHRGTRRTLDTEPNSAVQKITADGGPSADALNAQNRLVLDRAAGGGNGQGQGANRLTLASNNGQPMAHRPANLNGSGHTTGSAPSNVPGNGRASGSSGGQHSTNVSTTAQSSGASKPLTHSTPNGDVPQKPPTNVHTTSNVPKRDAIIVTPDGVAVTPATLRGQGTAVRYRDFARGDVDFRDLRSLSADDLVARIPGDWKWASSKDGRGITFSSPDGKMHVNILDASDGLGSWVVRVSDGKGNYFDNAGNRLSVRIGDFDNVTDIPLRGNPRFLLNDAMNKRVLDVLRTQDKKPAGPVLSGIYDPRTRQTFFGQNFRTTDKGRDEYKRWLAEDADPIIRNMEHEYAAKLERGEIKKTERHDNRLAGHSEIQALDQVIKARRAAGMPVDEKMMSELYLQNIYLPSAFRAYKAMPDAFNTDMLKPMRRCNNCEYLTDGINIAERL